MPTFDERLREAIIARHGTTVDLTTNFDILRDVVAEIQREGLATPIKGVAADAYDKHYTEGYNKGDYSKADYSRYDKTNNDIWDDIRDKINPEISRLIVERFRSRVETNAMDGSMFQTPVFDYLLLKLASRCNLDCSYCYWFRDRSVLEKPPLLQIEVEFELLRKIELHVVRYELKQFSILFHGGEPLLFGKRRFVGLATRLREIETRTGCLLNLSTTTNGGLLDDEWAAILSHFEVSVTLSIDGPANIHDKTRVDHKGGGSHEAALQALQRLRRWNMEPGVLAVCNPDYEPDETVDYFVDELHLKHFDILVPDATYQDNPQSISAYYTRLFDLWYDKLAMRGIEVRYVRAVLKGVLGGSSHLESIGYGPVQSCAVLTDGALEPVDVLRIAGYRSTATTTSILTHTFQDVIADPVWRRAFDAAVNLPATCQQCDYALACGGGFLPHRWSPERQYDNPSVYCQDLMRLFTHVRRRVADDLQLETDAVI